MLVSLKKKVSKGNPFSLGLSFEDIFVIFVLEVVEKMEEMG